MDRGYLPRPPSAPGLNPQDMHQRFIEDQQMYTNLGVGYPSSGSAQLPSLTQPPAHPLGAGMEVSNRMQTNGMVGWGGQAIQDNSGYKVPWFGRSRTKYQRHRTEKSDGRGSRGNWDMGPLKSNHNTRNAADYMSVEDLVAVFQKLGKRDPLPDTVLSALYHLDSRAAALLLKDLSRVGLDARAVELFDWLRLLDDRDPRLALCDVYTFTAMISLCIHQQDVDRALELVEDMKRRRIERNVHTYTALMNVCIKCGKHSLALDVYNSMRHFNCVPNVVTFNTLIDVYGKLGQWEKAVQVIDLMKLEGVEPVIRTFNTLIIACNMCNQPRESLAVYQRLLADGFAPNSTTYNALISAYGKTNQLDKALDVYEEMLRQNMERSVITYSSLISACEKAGQWETALRIFKEMQQDGCAPNTVTYNSLITACGQGGQWEKAAEVFEQMSTVAGCTPDVVTYTALISAYERGGQWQRALQAFNNMCLQGCKPDAIVYNAIIDTLWETGIIWAQSKAEQLFGNAVQQGLFKQEPLGRKPGRVELNLHAMTAGVAMLSLYSWLQDIKRIVAEQGAAGLPRSLAIVTDVGRISREQGNCVVKEAVSAMMTFWEAPFRPVHDPVYASVLEASAPQVADWASSPAFLAQVASLFTLGEASKVPDDTYPVREQQVQAECLQAFDAVTHFESTHGLNLHNMSQSYIQQRSLLISRLLEISSKLGLRDELVHDAVLLMDRTASQAKTVPEDMLPLIGVAALMICCKQGDSSDRVPTAAEIEALTEIPGSAVANMEWSLRGLLNEDTAAISSMRCLKIYLERLGYRYLDKPDVYGMAGFAIMLTVESLYDMSLLNCRPSVVAAALLYAERRSRGVVPFWPSMLAKFTGYEDMSTPELTVAVRTAQKLSRKAVYSQMYKAQLSQLSVSNMPKVPTELLPLVASLGWSAPAHGPNVSQALSPTRPPVSAPPVSAPLLFPQPTPIGAQIASPPLGLTPALALGRGGPIPQPFPQTQPVGQTGYPLHHSNSFHQPQGVNPAASTPLVFTQTPSAMTQPVHSGGMRSRQSSTTDLTTSNNIALLTQAMSALNTSPAGAVPALPVTTSPLATTTADTLQGMLQAANYRLGPLVATNPAVQSWLINSAGSEYSMVSEFDSMP